MANLNGPFPRCCLSRFRSESWCSTIVKEISLICTRIRNSFPFEWLCTRTRFETEESSNSEMGFWGTGEQRWWVTTYLREQGSINHFRDQENNPFPPTTAKRVTVTDHAYLSTPRVQKSGDVKKYLHECPPKITRRPS